MRHNTYIPLFFACQVGRSLFVLLAVIRHFHNLAALERQPLFTTTGDLTETILCSLNRHDYDSPLACASC
jgi:hypothetical protein